MKRFIAMIAVITIITSTCIMPALAITFYVPNPETGEITVVTEEDIEENKADAREEMEKELEAWIAEGDAYISKLGGKMKEINEKAFLTGNRLSAESSGYIGKAQETKTSAETGKNAMFYLKDNVLVITGSGIVSSQYLEYPLDMFALNEHIEVIIIGPGITWTGYIGANLPNLKAVIAMDVNTIITGCFANNGQYLPGYWEDCSMTQRVIIGAGLNFEEWTNKVDYTDVLSTKTKPAYGGAPSVEVEGIVMIAPNYNDPIPTAGGFKHPDVILPAGLGYNELVAKAKELLAHGDYGQEFPKAMYDYLPVELGGTGKIKLEAGKFYLGENQTSGNTTNSATTSEPATPVETETTNNISSWAETDVNRAKSIGIVPDTLPVNFTQNITREDFCEIITPLYEQLTGKEITEYVKFSDTNNTSVEKLAGAGIVGGTGADTFAPNNNLTRAEAAAIFARIGNKLGLNTNSVNTNFTDCSNHWAKNEIQTCSAMGLMNGTNETTFSPTGNLTIEQAIVIALRAYDKIV